MRVLLASILIAGVTFLGIFDSLARHRPLLGSPELQTGDSLMYWGLISRASFEGDRGDPFIYEHRGTPSAATGGNHAVRFLGWCARHVGLDSCVLLLPAAYALWLFGLTRIYMGTGVPPGFSLFLAALIPGAVIGLAQSWVGGGWLALFDLVRLLHPGDYWRLYPTTLSMAVYALATWQLLSVKDRPGVNTVLAGVLAGLSIYGRPFDWIVLMIFQVLLFLEAALNRKPALRVARLLGILVAIAVALPYLASFLGMTALHGAAMSDVLSRHALQAKEWSHYAKYTLGATVVLTASLALKRLVLRIPSPVLDRAWLLLVASLLGHLYTLPGRQTLFGIYYFAVFSIAPWGFVWLTALLAGRFSGSGVLRRNRFWAAAAFALALGHAVCAHAVRLDILSMDTRASARAEAYARLKSEPAFGTEAVVLSLDHPTEMPLVLGCRPFAIFSLIQTSGAPTPELFERYLLALFLIRGDLEPVAKIVAAGGMPQSVLDAAMDPSERRWFHRLVGAIGDGNLIFHPVKNRADLRARGIALPPHLAQRDETVVYLPPRFTEVYRRARETAKRTSAVAPLNPGHRLDYCVLPLDEDLAGISRSGFIAIFQNLDYRVWRRVFPRE